MFTRTISMFSTVYNVPCDKSLHDYGRLSFTSKYYMTTAHQKPRLIAIKHYIAPHMAY